MKTVLPKDAPRVHMRLMVRDGTRRPLIYIAGPIGQDESQWGARLRDALQIADVLLSLGALPYVPHLGIAWHRCTGPKALETWMALNEGVLERCDAMIRMPGDSPGADQETAFARGRGIHVFTCWSEVEIFIRQRMEEAVL